MQSTLVLERSSNGSNVPLVPMTIVTPVVSHRDLKASSSDWAPIILQAPPPSPGCWYVVFLLRWQVLSKLWRLRQVAPSFWSSKITITPHFSITKLRVSWHCVQGVTWPMEARRTAELTAHSLTFNMKIIICNMLIRPKCLASPYWICPPKTRFNWFAFVLIVTPCCTLMGRPVYKNNFNALPFGQNFDSSLTKKKFSFFYPSNLIYFFVYLSWNESYRAKSTN